MSNVGKKIERLISDGFSYNTLRGLSESQINLLYNRLVEQVDSAKVDELRNKVVDLRNQLSAAGEDMKKLGLAEDDIDNINPYKGQQTQQPEEVGPSSDDGFNNYQDGEVTEKFESKSQQRLFWAQCKNAKSPKAKKKWCNWAKEFSDKTEDFNKLPEKKKDMKKIEEKLTKLVERYIPESITKRELFRMLEQASAPSPTKPKTAPTTKPERKNNPFHMTKTHPKPKAGDTQTAPAKPKTAPTTKPERKNNPFQMPKTHPKPKAMRKSPSQLSYKSFISQGNKLS
jgi:hypothetical protein